MTEFCHRNSNDDEEAIAMPLQNTVPRSSYSHDREVDGGLEDSPPELHPSTQPSTSSSSTTAELTEALRREANLKARVDELVSTLEKLTRNSEARHQQSADFVDDLKRANASLQGMSMRNE